MWSSIDWQKCARFVDSMHQWVKGAVTHIHWYGLSSAEVRLGQIDTGFKRFWEELSAHTDTLIKHLEQSTEFSSENEWNGQKKDEIMSHQKHKNKMISNQMRWARL